MSAPELSPHPDRPGSRRALVAALALAALVAGALAWRAALPNNRERGGMDYALLETDGVPYYLPRGTNNYDNVATQVVARNFARDGFLRTRFLPNRGRAPLVSLYDRTGTQCEALAPPRNVLTYWNASGERVANVSANNDCVYIHYGALSDVVYGLIAAAGLAHVLAYKLLAVALNAALVLATFLWLRREVRDGAALTGAALLATLPAFLHWGDALFFHSFHFLFLTCGLITWTTYLRERRRRDVVLTWILYACTALVSHQLTFFFGIALFGLTVLEPGRETWGRRAKLLAVQASAPVAAMALHFTQCAALLGPARAWRNLATTMPARVTEGVPNGFAALMEWIGRDLAPWPLAAGAVLVIVAAGRLTPAPTARRLGLLATFFAGGISFMVVFPGTTGEHAWMMFRQLIPFVVVLLALLADAVADAIAAFKRGGPRVPAAAVAALGAGLLAWVGYRHAVQIVHEVRWNVARNRLSDPDNLVRRHLDVLHWTEGSRPRSYGIPYLPVSSMRVAEPPAWSADFRMIGPSPSHYEVWWLEEVPLRTVQLLTDSAAVQAVREHCMPSFLDGRGFHPASRVETTSEPFVPAPGERRPPKPYGWVRWTAASPVSSRALRLTCTGLDMVIVRQIEAFSR